MMNNIKKKIPEEFHIFMILEVVDAKTRDAEIP